ncbi:MAG TPA: lysoplasmalogenase [Anaeromyxobacteraceae bacterium]|nr:lysoplasmalogenase [Anaeromyxobacteraceae bacterium]
MTLRLLAAWMAVAVGASGLAGLLRAEVRGGARAPFKATASAGFVALALLLRPEASHERWILVGLCLSALGDLLLLSASRRAFLAGLTAFLLAHLAYAVAFRPLASPSPWAAAAILAATALVLRWLWPHLGRMRLPVIAYCAVIGLMLWLALGVDRPEIRLGGLLFWLSDLLVARHRFVRAEPRNRLVGLPLYYAGQYLIALALA